MEHLTLPNSKQISAIIQISDFHIRIGDIEKSRFLEYKATISNLEQMIANLPQVKNNSTITIFCGDMFNFKNRLDSLSVKLFYLLINTITKYTPLYIIQGNHDFCQSNAEIPDVLSSLLSGGINHTVHYLDKTGLYQAGNLGIGLVDIKDTLRLGDGSGHVEKLPPFPDSHLFPTEVTSKIALFHGSFKNAIYQTDTVANEGLPIDWIKSKGYDIGLFGDIHKAQIHPSNNWGSQFVWGYSSSMIQLDFGESYDGHGFFLWDLVSKTVSQHEIYCPSKFINITYQDTQLICHLDRKTLLSLDQFLARPNPPKHLYIKLKGEIPLKTLDDLQTILQKHYITANFTKSLVVTSNDSQEMVSNDKVSNSENHIDLSQYNTAKMWINYIEQSDTNYVLNDSQWKDWIRDPKTLLLSNMITNNPALEETTKSRDKDISNLIDHLELNMSQLQDTIKPPFTIRSMTWDYILCYGKGNSFNFSQNTNKIVVINGHNSSGKSSFLETIAFGLYGDDFPSRKDRQGSSAIICHKKPSDEHAQITIMFSIGHKDYQIQRIFEQNPKTNNLSTKKISLTQLDTVKPIVITTSVKNANDWVVANIGQFDNFIMSCIITQVSDADFFNLKDNEQVKLLDDVLHINTIDDVSSVIKAVSLGLEALEKQCTTLRTYCASELKHNTTDPVALEQLKTTLLANKSQCETLQSQIQQIKETWHELDINDLQLSDSEITHKIAHFQQLVDQLPTLDALQLSNKMSLIQDKISHLPNVEPIHIAIDQAKQELETLQSYDMVLPPCTLAYYQEQLQKIDQWRQQHQSVITSTVEKLDEQLTKQQALSLDYVQKLQNLINHKPNHPEITFDQYHAFLDNFNTITQLISLLPSPFNQLNELEQYCQTHPLPIIKGNKQELIDQYSKETKLVDNPTWFTDDLSPLLDTQLHHKQQLVTNLHDINQQIETIEHTSGQINVEIDHLTDQINDIGQLSKPRKPLVDVKEWIRKFSIKQNNYPQNETRLTSITKQLASMSQKVDKNNQIHQQLDQITHEITQIVQQEIPFNPNCEACCRQPWKIRHQQLLSQQQQLSLQLDIPSPNNDQLEQLKHTIEQLTQWITEYNRFLKLLPDYQEMEINWGLYQDKNQRLLQYRTEKNDKSAQFDAFKKSLKTLKQQKKQLENDHDHAQQIINGMSYVINNRPNWDKIKLQIDEIEQYEHVADIRDLFRRYSQLNPVYHQQQGLLLDAHRQWDQEHADLTQKIQSNNQQIEYLKQNLVYSTNELEYNRHIEQWKLYHQNCHRITQLQNVVYLDQLRVVETSLSQVDLKRQYQNQLSYWLQVRDNKSKYLNKCELSLQVSKLLPIIQTLSVQYETDTHFYDLFIKKNQEIITYDRLSSVIVTKKDKINFIYKTLANYRIWLYREIVIPKIITTVNNLVSVVTECSEYSLTANITVDRYNKVLLNWSITSPSGSSSIEKSGGFRKYIYGLIMRISLAQMGCSHINNTQLFLDEGFTSCDLNNLDKMPQFLGNLLDFFSNGIILVSHLLTIRECANTVVEIQQNPDKTSRIVFERSTYPIDKHKLVLRKQPSI